MSDCLSSKSALYVAQQGVEVLFNWLDITLPESFRINQSIDLEIQTAVARAKQILNWSENPQILQLVKNDVNLSVDSERRGITYWQPQEIEDNQPTIPYPLKQKRKATDNQEFKDRISQEIQQLELQITDWHNLSFLTMLLEKYGSFLSLGREDISLIDMVMTTAALAGVLTIKSTTFSLVAGNLLGIKEFITHISSRGTVRYLQARSFYLEIVKQEIIQQLLKELNLPHANLIYSGNDLFFILAPLTKTNRDKLVQIRRNLNQYLLSEFQGKIFLSLESQDNEIQELDDDRIAECWLKLNHKLAMAREQKFSEDGLVNQLLIPQISSEPCALCHRDDLETLTSLNQYQKNPLLICPICSQLFALGKKLPLAKAIVRSTRTNISGSLERVACIDSSYHLFANYADVNFEELLASEAVFVVNDWQLEHYRQRHVIPLRWGIYGEIKGKLAEETDLAPTLENNIHTNQVKKIAYLAICIDDWWQILINKLKGTASLARLRSLFRQMDYWGKIYLTSLAKNRDRNLASNSQVVKLSNQKSYSNLAFIHTGCNYFLLAGVWNEVIEFCFDIYQCFRAYTAYNSELSISAGISTSNSHFSVYQAVKNSQTELASAKSNGGDSLSLLGEVFKWDEWFGIPNCHHSNIEIQQYLQPENKPEILGILPLVQKLQKQLNHRTCRHFCSNLLATAQLQEQQLQEAKHKSHSDRQAIRYFLNLPKIAYTLSQLPINIRDRPDFAQIRTSLKNPWNAVYFRAIATLLKLVNYY